MNARRILRLSTRAFHTFSRKPTYSIRKRLLKYGLVSGALITPGVYFHYLDDKDKRQISITLGGVERFFR